MKKKPPATRRTYVKQPHEVVQDALLLAGRQAGPEEQLEAHGRIAKQLGVSTSMLYKWRQPAVSGSGSPNPLERTAQLLAVTGDRAFTVVADDFVTVDDGSGIVHLAPAFGEIDREGLHHPHRRLGNQDVQCRKEREAVPAVLHDLGGTRLGPGLRHAHRPARHRRADHHPRPGRPCRAGAAARLQGRRGEAASERQFPAVARVSPS